LGIKPDRPATGFGYIRVAERAYGDAYVAGGFVEKPGVELAQQYLESGEYLWNAGMFFMGTDVLLQAVQRHRPAWSEAVAAGVADTTGEALRQFFSQVESVSIDVAIMEPEGEALLVIPADCGWCDLGSWSALLDFANQGTSYAKGPTRLVDVEDSVIVSEGPRVTVMGLTNVCVVATGDEVLVLDLASDQAVRALALSDKDKSE
jgi:mannose-1-phosphate guanylyltransferase/mannose-1-phosphate guanylyltransferase/mannose-6-phosphate isomerase